MCINLKQIIVLIFWFSLFVFLRLMKNCIGNIILILRRTTYCICHFVYAFIHWIHSKSIDFRAVLKSGWNSAPSAIIFLLKILEFRHIKQRNFKRVLRVNLLNNKECVTFFDKRLLTISLIFYFSISWPTNSFTTVSDRLDY